MSDKAAIAGTFADFKLIRSRGVCQVVVEVPIEQADAALAALGGLPTTATDRWVAVARMHGKPQDEPAEKNKGGELAKRAAILCNDPAFQRWIYKTGRVTGFGPNSAANYVRSCCRVESRADLDHNPTAGHCFLTLEQQFRDEQRYGPAAAQQEQYA